MKAEEREGLAWILAAALFLGMLAAWSREDRLHREAAGRAAYGDCYLPLPENWPASMSRDEIESVVESAMMQCMEGRGLRSPDPAPAR